MPQASECHTIRSPSGDLELQFCPEAGGCVIALRRHAGAQTTDIFRPHPPTLPLTPGHAASFPMTPLSNRISGCVLRFEGEVFNLGPSYGEEPNYLHGDGWTQPWSIGDIGPHHAVLRLYVAPNPLSPYVYEAEQVLSLADGILDMDIAVTNRGRRLPFGTGHHPFFPRTSRTVLAARLTRVWLCDADMHPTRLVDVPEKWNFSRGVRMADPALLPAEHGFRGRDLIDNCFPGWDGRAEITQPDLGYTLLMTADPVFRNFVIYDPAFDRDVFAAEAVTNIIDGFNLHAMGVPDTGTIVLDPGQTLAGRTRFAVLAL